jgi:hypothetical protein
MKRIIVIAVLTAGYLIPVFAQHGIALHNPLIQKDSTLYQISVQNTLSANNTAKYGIPQWRLNDIPTKKLSPLPAFKRNNLNFALNRPSTMEKMPCLKPVQKDRTPVIKPDSAVKHTLLIKKF